MGRPKALLPWRRGTFLSGAIQVLNNYTDLVIVVAGGLAPELQPIVDANAAYLVRNLQPERGQFSSLQLGLQEVLNRGRDAAIITLVDRPSARPETVNHLQRHFLAVAEHDMWAVIPEFEGSHGHPIVVGREMIGAFLDAPADRTARDIVHANLSRIAYVPVSDPFVTMNIDTPQDYERLIASPEFSVTR